MMLTVSKISSVLLFTGTIWYLSSAAGVQNNAEAMDLTGSTWAYEDDDEAYDISFKKNGYLTSTNPNDVTKGNDSWKQKGNTVKFYFNKKYSRYTGTFQNSNTITGSAINKKGATWSFKLQLREG